MTLESENIDLLNNLIQREHKTPWILSFDFAERLIQYLKLTNNTFEVNFKMQGRIKWRAHVQKIVISADCPILL